MYASKRAATSVLMDMSLALIVTAAIMGCERQAALTEDRDADGAKQMEEQALVDIAQQYLSKQQPEWDEEVSSLAPRVTECADYWEVTWELPPGMIGGTPVIHIDKRTGKVVKAYHEQ